MKNKFIASEVVGHYLRHTNRVSLFRRIKIGYIKDYNKIDDNLIFSDFEVYDTNLDVNSYDWIHINDRLYYVLEASEISKVTNEINGVEIKNIYHKIDTFEDDDINVFVLSFSYLSTSMTAGDRDYTWVSFENTYLDCLYKTDKHMDYIYTIALIMFNLVDEDNNENSIEDYEFELAERMLYVIDKDVFSYGIYEESGDGNHFIGRNTEYHMDDNDGAYLEFVDDPITPIYVENELFSYKIEITRIHEESLIAHHNNKNGYRCYIYINKGVESIDDHTFDDIQRISILTNYKTIPESWNLSESMRLNVKTDINLTCSEYFNYVKNNRTDKFYSIIGEISDFEYEQISRRINDKQGHLVEIDQSINFLIVSDDLLNKYSEHGFTTTNNIEVIGVNEFLGKTKK